MLCVVLGCSDGESSLSSSGLPADKSLADLTDADRAQLCEWASGLTLQVEPGEYTCDPESDIPDVIIGDTPPSLEECARNMQEEYSGCADGTVSQAEHCASAITRVEEPCQLEEVMHASCDELLDLCGIEHH